MITKKDYFLNLENGSLDLNTYRNTNAVSTTLDDILSAVKHGSKECLTAICEQQFEYYDDLKIAVFSGVSFSSEGGFDICDKEEVNNVKSYKDGLGIWGLDEDLWVTL